MPNNIANKLVVSAETQAEIENFLYAIAGVEGDETLDIDFERIVPMPECLSNTKLALFSKINDQALEDEAEDVIKYFDGKMPDDLKDKIDYEIYKSFRRVEAEDALNSYGFDCFSNLSLDEYEEMSREELIERCMEEADGELDFYVVEIQIA